MMITIIISNSSRNIKLTVIWTVIGHGRATQTMEQKQGRDISVKHRHNGGT